MVETPIHLEPGAMRDWSVWIFTGLDNLCDRSDKKVGVWLRRLVNTPSCQLKFSKRDEVRGILSTE